MIGKHKTIRSQKLRRSARGQTCSVRVPGVCNHNPETVVLAHVNGGGMGMKKSDVLAAYACSACHEWLDSGYVRNSDTYMRDHYHLKGVAETMQRFIDAGLIGVA